MDEKKVFPLLKQQEFMVKTTEGMDNCMASPTSPRVHGKIDLDRLEKAIQSVVDRNDALRFVLFQDENGVVYQKILEEYKYKLKLIKTFGETLEDRENNAVEIAEQMMRENNRFDGSVAWDIILFDLEDDEYIIFFRFNHVINDGVGNSIIMAEIDAFYRGIPLPEKKVGFEDYIRENMSDEHIEKVNKQVDFWYKRAEGFKEFIEIPNGKTKRSPLRPFFSIPVDNLKKFAREKKQSLFKVNLFLIHACISATYGVSDTIISCSDGTRSREHTQTIGFLTNGYLNRMIFQSDVSMRDAFDMFSKDFDVNSKEARVSFVIPEPCKFYITYQNYYKHQTFPFCDVTAEPFPGISDAVLWNLFCFVVFEAPEQILYMIGCDETVFPQDILDKMHRYFELGAKCLGEKDMTFAEFCKALNEEI